MLQEGKNVATTHQLFKHLDEECYNLISEGGYELILDEVVTSVQDFPIKDKDITLLLNQNIIKEDRAKIWIIDIENKKNILPFLNM